MSVLAIAAAAASMQGGVEPRGAALDLALSDVRVVGVEFVGDRFEIEISYRVTNVGGFAYDPEGFDLGSSLDNASIQTYLTDSDDPNQVLVIGAAGGAINGAPVIAPGESFSGTFFSNTAQLLDPTAFGEFTTLAVQLRIPGEEPENLSNNTAFVTVPSPGGSVVLGALGLCAARRRRGSQIS